MSLLILNTNLVEKYENTVDSRLADCYTRCLFTDKPYRQDLYFGRIINYKDVRPRYCTTESAMACYPAITNIKTTNATFYDPLITPYTGNQWSVPLITFSVEMREPPDTRMSEFIYALMENGEI